MIVLQHENRRSVGRGQCVDRANRRQRIIAASILLCLTRYVQTGFNVPGCQLPLLVVAELGDFSEGILVFVGLDPNACKTCSRVFGETICQFQLRSPVSDVVDGIAADLPVDGTRQSAVHEFVCQVPVR